MLTTRSSGRPTWLPELPPAESSTLSQWIARAQAGYSGAVLLTGSLGAGKSTFVDIAIAESRRHSFRIGRVAFPGPRLLESGESDAPDRVVAIDQTSVSEVLRQARLHGDRWLITLDDAHQEPPGEVAALARVVESSRSGTLFLATAGDTRESSERLTELIAQLVAVPGLVMHQLPPWSAAHVQRFVSAQITTVTPSIRFAFELARITGGKPTFVRAYCEAVASLPEDEQLRIVSGARRLIDMEPPDLVREIILARTADTTGEARRLLQTLAVWSLPADAETLARLSGLEEDEVFSGLDELEEAGHVSARTDGDTTQFSLPDLVTARVVAGSTPSLRALGVHRQASVLLARQAVRPSQLTTRALHHLAAGPLDTQRAEQVVAAASALLDRGRWATARGLLEPVVREAVQGALGPDLLVKAVHALAATYTRSGDTAIAERLVEATRVRADGVQPEYLDSLLGLARGWAGSGRELEAESAFRYVAAHPSTPRRARYGALAELVRSSHRGGEPERAVTLARFGRSAHRGQADAESALWFQQAIVSYMRGRPADALREARLAFWLATKAGDQTMAAAALVSIGEAWLDTDSADRALRWMRGGFRRAERAQSFADAAWARNRIIPAYLEAGQWEEAELAARRGISHGVSLNLPQTTRRSEAALALVQALTGRTSHAFLGTKITADDLGNPLLVASVATSLYEQQRTARMDAHARQTIRFAAHALRDIRGWERLLQVEILPRLAEDHMLHRDARGLDETIAIFQHLNDGTPTTLPIARLELMVVEARLALLRQKPDEAAALLEIARGGYQAMALRWRWAQASSLLGLAYSNLGRKAKAIETLRSGYVALEALGAQRDAQWVRQQLQGIGGRAPRGRGPSAPLTPRQMDVAMLAARGFSDKEIARELGTSHRTTTTHMHAILKRLSLRSRFELAEWFERNPELGPT